MNAAVHQPNSAKARKSSLGAASDRPVPAQIKPVETVSTRVTLVALMRFVGSVCMPGSRFLFAALLFVLLLPVRATAGEVRIAVAANFAPTLRVLAADFSAQTGHRAQISSGSTGKHYAQIRNGAGFDVFLAADSARPARLEVEGIGIAGSRFTYAVGRLVLWVPGETETRSARGLPAECPIPASGDRQSAACALRAGGTAGARDLAALGSPAGEAGPGRERCPGVPVRRHRKRAGGSGRPVAAARWAIGPGAAPTG